VSYRKQAILAGMVFFGAAGDTTLAYGMKLLGPVSIHHLGSVIAAIFTPWVALGILLLIGFFATYLSALSFADLTYVLPATSVGYILMALLARFLLHENIEVTRWLGIVLIAAGVGFVAGGPAKTNTKETAHGLVGSALGERP